MTILDRIIIPGTIPLFYKALIIIFITLTASLVSQFGDLMASKLKRHYNIKDFGTIFPGHGGIMDRFDSVIMVSLYLFSILNILHLLG
jgi:phosphatidate cytidylyltransferase